LEITCKNVHGSQKQVLPAVKNPQFPTSAFYPLLLQISSTKIIRILPISTSARPHFTIGLCDSVIWD